MNIVPRFQALVSTGELAPLHPVEILPYLMLGDKRSADDLPTLEAFGITHILNVAGRSCVTAHAGRVKAYQSISAQDEEGYPILQRHNAAAAAFIQQARAEVGRRN